MERKGKSGIRALQMDILRGLLDIKRKDGVMKGVDERLTKVFSVGLAMY